MSMGGEEKVGGGFIELRLDDRRLDADLAQEATRFKAQVARLQAIREEDARAALQAARALGRQKQAIEEEQIQQAIAAEKKGLEEAARMRAHYQAGEERAARAARGAMAGRADEVYERTQGGMLLGRVRSRSGMGADMTAAEAAKDEARFMAVAKGAKEAGKATADSGHQSGMAAMKWMILAQTLDDAQYGFRSIVNNIPLLAGAFFGFGGKFAAAISIGAVALNQLMIHIKEIAPLFGISEGQVEKFWRSIGMGADKAKQSLERFIETQEKLKDLLDSRVAGATFRGGDAAGRDVGEAFGRMPGGAEALADKMLAKDIEEDAKKGGGKYKNETVEMDPRLRRFLQFAAPGVLAGIDEWKTLHPEPLQDPEKLKQQRDRYRRDIGLALGGDQEAEARIRKASPEFGRQLDRVKGQQERKADAASADKVLEDQDRQIDRAASAAMSGPSREGILRGRFPRAPDNVSEFGGDKAYRDALARLRRREIEDQQAKFGGTPQDAENALALRAQREQMERQREFLQDELAMKRPQHAQRFGSWDEGMWSIQQAGLDSGNVEKEQLKRLEEMSKKMDEQIKVLEGLDPRLH